MHKIRIDNCTWSSMLSNADAVKTRFSVRYTKDVVLEKRSSDLLLGRCVCDLLIELLFLGDRKIRVLDLLD